MGGSPAPKPDEAMGKAALLSARTGRDLLKWMQDQASISNAWAEEDRERWNTVFKPLEDQFVTEAWNYDTAERRNAAATQAGADVQQAMQRGQGQHLRQMSALGVRPDSGRGVNATSRMNTDTALARAGAENTARRQVEADGYMRKAAAVNLGSGYAVNPATSLGMATGAGAAGFQGAMQGYGQKADILNAQYGQQMQQWQATNSAASGLFGGLGAIVGYGLQNGWFAALSSEDAKTDKVPATGKALGAVRDMRVDEWTYKPGMGDGGRHIGPYAEEFAEATGVGDGKTINLIDAVGVALGAIKDLDRKVEAIAS